MFLHCYRDRAYSTGIHSNQRHTLDRLVPHSPPYTHSLQVSAEQVKVQYISQSYQLWLVKISLHIAEYSHRIFFPFVILKHILKISSELLCYNQYKNIPLYRYKHLLSHKTWNHNCTCITFPSLIKLSSGTHFPVDPRVTSHRHGLQGYREWGVSPSGR